MMTYEYLSYFVFGTSISTYRVADLLCKIFFFFFGDIKRFNEKTAVHGSKFWTIIYYRG